MVARMERWDSLAQQVAGQRGRKVFDCLCPDGKRRTATLTGEADSYFSIPATVHAGGVRVKGYVTGIETDGARDYAFRVVYYGKNCWVFPEDALLPGARVQHVIPESGQMVWHGVISHWYRDNRPYYEGPPRWLVVLSNVVWNDAMYGPSDDRDGQSWMQNDAVGLMKGLHEGRIRVEGGRQIGPQIIDFSGHGGGIWTE